ncbi:cytochrome c oxidase subunit II [Natronolimnohabitans sp. A-GB9]|uniref:cytochrome c oxidase subunit II n=1 Tax=Natronolimnohabitans sp. A-GB9 TaxID=3069757 RepID=UPI0027B4C436|nr:cytochrome c oxidase subunit II [Natronolimnohabitans sp. A-GB9]MDQ2049734.1 cytochrome c oxidase subunit II [Natronolimnohabitans sp. A-GB9]
MQQSRVDVFESIFLVFLGLGTLVGVVVVAYTLYNAYKYRDAGEPKDDESLPTLGELPTGGKGGKKLFLSFGISAVIVISLVVWTYGMLLYVEDPEDEFDEEPVEIEVVGDGFAWHFEYENGVQATNTMNVPADQPVAIEVTSGDVWHSFGISDLRVKADAIPGEYDETWFMAEEAGEEHRIECFELCGDGHSAMDGTAEVMEQDQFHDWLDSQLALDVTLETEDEEAVTNVTDEFDVELVHVEDGTEYTFDGADFDEEGTLALDEELEQGGEFELTITFEDTVTYEDEETDTIEDTISVTGPSSETYTIDLDAADDNDENDDAETDEGGDDE